ncbi:MAG: divalent metal cation transporter [Acidobacteriota bacterium]|nr:divalent metal cation transporter [Acidobacteriota bacterium]
MSRIGPGIISGAANDDPSCIVTYSMAGAALGYATLWTSLFGLPLLAAVQSMCARLGMVSGRGLAGCLRLYSPKWVLFSMCALLAIANIVTLGADLGGMAEVTAMVTGIPAVACTLIYAVAIAGLLFYIPFTRIERIFKWLCLALFTYLAAGFLAHADWRAALLDTALPRVQWSKEYLSVIVAIIGPPCLLISCFGRLRKRWKRNTVWGAAPWRSGRGRRGRNSTTRASTSLSERLSQNSSPTSSH